MIVVQRRVTDERGRVAWHDLTRHGTHREASLELANLGRGDYRVVRRSYVEEVLA